MSETVHVCELPPRNIASGFPKLPPNASYFQKIRRTLRKFTALDPNNTKCKEFFHSKSSRIVAAKQFVNSSYFFVIHPFSICHSVIGIIFFCLWLYSLLDDPLMIFFPSELERHFSENDSFLILLCQKLIMISFFFVGYIDNKSKQIIVEPKKIILHYLKTYFIFDLTATTISQSLFGQVMEYIMPDLVDDDVKLLLWISGILCYYTRLNTVLQYLLDITKFFNLPKTLQTLILDTLRTLILLHLCTCMLYAIPTVNYSDHWPEQSWLYQAGITTENSTFSKKYLECCLFSVCYFFGASHGMYEVTLPGEELSLSIITLVGRIYTLFLLADLLKLLGIVDVSSSNYEQQLNHLNGYIISKNLPKKLGRQLLRYYEYKFKGHYFNEPEIYGTISEPLKAEIFLFAARNLARRLYIFKTLPKDTLINIISLMKLQTYSPRDVIIKIDEPMTDVYFISSGTVAVINKSGLELCHLDDSDEFGIISEITEINQKHLIVAVEPTEVFWIHKGILISLLQDNAEIMARMHYMVDKRTKMLETLEKNVVRGGTTFIADLQSGNVLEVRKRRPLIGE